MATLLRLNYSCETYKPELQRLLCYNQGLLVLASTCVQQASGHSTIFHVFDTSQTFLAAIESFPNIVVEDMFARASNGFVVIGISILARGCGCPTWYVKGYDAYANLWTKQWIDLPDEIGPLELATAFEAFDGYFYALSAMPWSDHYNESVAAESTHYSRIRIPLSLQKFDAMESFAVPRAPCLSANGIRSNGGTRRCAYYTSDIVFKEMWITRRISNNDELRAWVSRCLAHQPRPEVYIDGSLDDQQAIRTWFPDAIDCHCLAEYVLRGGSFQWAHGEQQQQEEEEEIAKGAATTTVAEGKFPLLNFDDDNLCKKYHHHRTTSTTTWPRRQDAAGRPDPNYGTLNPASYAAIEKHE
ncbi:hypothetical protein B0T26DRAFT_670953 [Lasiosphaeria miniovina]|uniref:Uncharacterized protein n=1 Tax=Lasiosphaeria miniovina TaxID=1954250 RepID=A0AA40BI66_9PEZI|nr:uncharacterized protein B0T26DRAFT_670953 [Lasiosphaeria miniovina]KAK0734694.1 hypothetical protein B0T26DRAFT_670953 [Lasiosphaeria miniovina]